MIFGEGGEMGEMSGGIKYNHEPPWKAVHWPGEHGGLWTVSNDAGDPRDEYDVFESPTEGEARLAAAAPDLLAACEAMAERLHEFSGLGRFWENRDQEALDLGLVALAKARPSSVAPSGGVPPGGEVEQDG
jgi:hypothetical protein